MRRGKRDNEDPKVVEARRLADEALQAMEELERALDEEDDLDADPWERELGMERAPWNAPGKDSPE